MITDQELLSQLVQDQVYLKYLKVVQHQQLPLWILGVDENRAEAVEKYFDEINPFDEAAEATAAGKITELIVNIGIPGGIAFKVGSGLTKATLQAKKAGKYLSSREKLRRFGKGAVAGGVAEGAFVGDVEDAGTFGDFLGGPTQRQKEIKMIHKQNY